MFILSLPCLLLPPSHLLLLSSCLLPVCLPTFYLLSNVLTESCPPPSPPLSPVLPLAQPTCCRLLSSPTSEGRGLLKQQTRWPESPPSGREPPARGSGLRDHLIQFYSLFFKKYFIYLFLDRGEGREKERERKNNVLLPLMLTLMGTRPATHACALTGNRTSNPLVYKPALNPLSHMSQGLLCLFYR